MLNKETFNEQGLNIDFFSVEKFLEQCFCTGFDILKLLNYF